MRESVKWISFHKGHSARLKIVPLVLMMVTSKSSCISSLTVIQVSFADNEPQ